MLAFLRHEKPDVLVLIDSQLSDKERIKHSLPGWKLLHESRPHGTHKKRLFGGITVLWQSDNVNVCRESACPKGALSFVVQDTKGRRIPVAVVALYSPPASSRLNRFGKKWSKDILDFFVEREQFREKFGFVVVGGDYNWRLGTCFGRRTEDRGGRGGSGPARTWHLRNDLRPLYGQHGEHHGVCTSRTDSGEAEPDGISVPLHTPPGWMRSALRPPPFDQYSSRGGVHVPLGVVVTPPQTVDLPEQQRRSGVDASRDADSTGAASERRLSPPPYGSAAYHTMSLAVLQCIVDVAAQLKAGSIDAAAAFTNVAGGLMTVQREYFETRPTASRINGKLHYVNLKRRNPSACFRRLASGMRMPVGVARELDERRKKVSRLLHEKSALKRRKESMPTDEFNASEQRVKAELREIALLRKQTQLKLDEASSSAHRREVTRLSHMITKHPRRFYRILNKKLPQPAGVFDESTGPSTEMSTEFREFFANLLRRAGAPLAGDIDEKYRANVHAGDPESGEMLVSVVVWQEVYAVLFPFHRKAVREACLPNCPLCPMFADHVSSFVLGDTRTTPPEHKPRLWTSKSPGPDGVFAETLRWACPKERGARHDYRKRVSEALASIFNHVIASGKVPQCPQFADSMMTALFKGEGDRKKPDNHRGICVPNVLAKLFGLVLGTRLSHWAVANGVISPAQAGFVVMHGCEHHIFTLFEALRYRVRNNEDTVVLFIDFKKAYDSVPQEKLWKGMQILGVPLKYVDILKSWAAQSRITLNLGGKTQAPFPQETGVPQGGVLSPICFNLFLEFCLRYVNARAADYGIELKTGETAELLRLLALAYADDIVLVCRSREAAQAALALVQEWAAAFGMTIGVGTGKTQAMLVCAATVKAACSNDVNGMPKRSAAVLSSASPTSRVDNPDGDHDTVFDSDDDDDDGSYSPMSGPEAPLAKVSRAPRLKAGQTLVNGQVRGRGTRKPRAYKPRPLPPIPDLPPLIIAAPVAGGDPVEVEWTNLYKYLGFMVRADLLDDHAYERVEKKMKAAAERLFPHHRLVRAWSLSQKLQLLQTIVLSVTANVMPLLTSMRCMSESKTRRLDQLWRKVLRSILRLHGSPRAAYVTAEAGIGDVLGCITQHRLRLQLSLEHHPLRGQPSPPVACQMLDFVNTEAMTFKQKQHSLLLAPWPLITERITGPTVQQCDAAGWRRPLLYREVAPYAAVVGRTSERSRWIDKLMQGIDWAAHSFAVRPPTPQKAHTASLHFGARLTATDAGGIPKLTPLSVRGPRCHSASMVALSRLLSNPTTTVSMARRGNWTMHQYPFTMRSSKALSDTTGTGTVKYKGKTCHLCDIGDDGPGLDLWHALFECDVTRDHATFVTTRNRCMELLPLLCDAIEEAVSVNGDSMNDSRSAGVDHVAITDAAAAVRAAAPSYDWNCLPGQWLVYMLLLAMPYPERVVRPDIGAPVWLCKPKRRSKGVARERDLTGMPQPPVPVVDAESFSLPLLVGRLFDCTVLPNNALRRVADRWCHHSKDCLQDLGRVVRPLRAAAEITRAIARAAQADEDRDGCSTSSWVSSSDSDSDTASETSEP